MSEFIPVYAVDFDGTLCESVWPGIGEPNMQLINHLIKRRSEGVKLILWTCRVGERLQEAVDWCKEHGLEFDAVNDNVPEMVERFGANPRKVYATCYIDDLSVNKEKYGIPFHKRVSITDERYHIGSRWMLKCDGFHLEVEVAEITKYQETVSMRVKSVSDNPGLKYYCCNREIEWYSDKLFPKEGESPEDEV